MPIRHLLAAPVAAMTCVACLAAGPTAGEAAESTKRPVARLTLVVALEGDPDPVPKVRVDVWPQVDHTVQPTLDGALPGVIVFYEKRPEYLIHVEAEGYVPMTGRVSFDAMQLSTARPPARRDEAAAAHEPDPAPWKPRWPTVDAAFHVRLRELAPPDHVCLTPDGEPAVDADVCVRGYGRFQRVENGRARTVFCTGPRGEVLLPSYVPRAGMTERPPAGMIFLHDSGCRILTRAEYQATRQIVLRPWGRIAGRVVLDGKPRPGRVVSLEAHRHPDEALSEVFPYEDYEATTGPDGRFVLDRLIPGNYDLHLAARSTTNEDRRTLARGMTAGVVSGRTTRVDVGGSGRSVTGRVRVGAALANQVDWAASGVSLQAAEPPQPAREHPMVTRADPSFDEPIRVRAVPATPYVERSARFRWHAALGEGGAFRATDVPPDEYTVNVLLKWIEPPPGLHGSMSLPKATRAIVPARARGEEEPFRLDDLDLAHAIRAAIEAAEPSARSGR